MTHPGGRSCPVLIGLTGPIGCGKSTIARRLGELGAVVVDADRVARDVTSPGRPAHDAVIARFGQAVTAPGGTLDRAALGRIVFADPVALRALEAIVHPAVRPEILAAIDAAAAVGAPAVVIEAIKLVEGGLGELCDEVWLVACDPAAQRRRLLGRGDRARDAEQRIAAQAGLADRLRVSATRVIDTGASEAAALAAAEAAYRDALGTAGEASGG